MVYKYLNIQKTFIKNSLQILFYSRLDFFILMFGKLVAMVFGVIWINSLYLNVQTIAGYTKNEMMVFLGVFFVLDRLIQILIYRSLWFVQVYVNNGELDRILLWPIKPLYTVSFKVIDINDFFTLIPSIIFLYYSLQNLQLQVSQTFGLMFFIVIGLIIAYSVLLAISSTSFFATKVENLYLLYREIANVGRFPPEIFGTVVSTIFLFIIPIFAIFTVPSKFILGTISFGNLMVITFSTLLLLLISLWYWNFAIKKYTSASS